MFLIDQKLSIRVFEQLLALYGLSWRKRQLLERVVIWGCNGCTATSQGHVPAHKFGVDEVILEIPHLILFMVTRIVAQWERESATTNEANRGFAKSNYTPPRLKFHVMSCDQLYNYLAPRSEPRVSLLGVSGLSLMIDSILIFGTRQKPPSIVLGLYSNRSCHPAFVYSLWKYI